MVFFLKIFPIRLNRGAALCRWAYGGPFDPALSLSCPIVDYCVELKVMLPTNASGKDKSMDPKTPLNITVFDIANWFLARAKAENKPLKHMKLQKLVYFAYG